jgi:hypothetical protein
MGRTSVFFLRLTFYLLLLSASVCGQAVVPNPADIAPVINPPNPQTNIVVSLGDYLTGNVSVFDAMRQALAACQQKHAAKLIIPTGTYVFDDPKVPQFNYHVGIGNLSDLVIDGQGSQFIFHYPTSGILLVNSQRIAIRNLTIDTDLPLASLGNATKLSDGRTAIRILDRYPVNAGMPVLLVAPYDIQNLKFKTVPLQYFISNPQNVTMIGPQIYTSPDFDRLTEGEEVVVSHYSVFGGTANVAHDVSDISFENIIVYGAPGGIILTGQRGFRLSNCKIMQKPGAQRPISVGTDAVHVLNTSGDILIEDCDISAQTDDGLNITGLWVTVTEKADSRTVILTRTRKDNPWAIQAGAQLKFVKPNNLSEYTRLKVLQVSYDNATGRFTATVDQDLPSTVAIGDRAISLTQSNQRFLVRRNYFHDNNGRAMVIQSPTGIVENNRIKNPTWQGLLMFTDAFFFYEGPGAESLIVRNNTFVDCSYGNYGTLGETMAAVNITADVPGTVSDYPVNKNILFEGNTIIDTPGLAMFVASASGVTISNNVIINSNTLGAFPPWYGSSISVTPHGSLMVTKASNVLISGNLQLTTPQQTEKGVFIDQQTTSGITSQGFYIDLLPPNVIDDSRFYVRQHYLDFLSRFPDSSGWDFWNNEITSCGTNQQCIDAKRINVSAAYFLSIEFQQTGYLVERIYKSAYGSASGTSTFGGAHQVPVPIVRFSEFLPDTQQIGQGVIVGQTGWETVLENNKQTFAAQFAQRSRFVSAFATSLTPAQFVDALFANAGVTPTAPDRAAAIAEFGSATNTSDVAARARALRKVAENSSLVTNEFNRAFVLMQFFGYLRRDPNSGPDIDYTGYDFWLTKLNQFNGNFVSAEMVKAFITSTEYRQRFGP